MRQAVIQDSVCVRLNARVYQESQVARAELAFRLNYMTADSVGAYILAVRFFRFLAHGSPCSLPISMSKRSEKSI